MCVAVLFTVITRAFLNPQIPTPLQLINLLFHLMIIYIFIMIKWKEFAQGHILSLIMRLPLPSFYYLCIHTEHWLTGDPQHLPQSLLSNKQEFWQESTLEWPGKEERGKAWGFTDSLTHPARVHCSPRFRDGWARATPCPHRTSVGTGNGQENEDRYYPRSGKERC